MNRLRYSPKSHDPCYTTNSSRTFVLFITGQRLVDGLTEKARRLDHLLLAFACLLLSVHYTLRSRLHEYFEA